MGKFISVFYRYRPIRKLELSAVIGIGRYGKKAYRSYTGLTHIKFNFEIPDIILYFSKKILAKNCSLQNVRIEKKCMYVHMFPKHHR